jgi:hypothetical protein
MRAKKAAVLAADRLLELSHKMRNALKGVCPCRVTARAMWLILEHELNNAVRNDREAGPFRVGQKRFMSIVKEKDLEPTAEYAVQFWSGFRDGIEDATMNNPHTKVYQYGYRSGALKDVI